MSCRPALALLLVAVVLSGDHGARGQASPRDARKPAEPAGAVRTDADGAPLPPGAIARLGTLRWRAPFTNGSGFTRVTAAPDGALVAAAGGFGLRIWEVGTGKAPAWFKPDPFVRAAFFAADGKTLLTAREQRERGRGRPEVVRWIIEPLQVGTGKVLSSAEITLSPDFHSAPQLSPNGKWIASREQGGKMSVWETASGQRVA
jgi:hypothetical protein